MLISSPFRRRPARADRARLPAAVQELETRQLLDATLPQLVNDSLSARSNGRTHTVDVLANDTPGDEELTIESVSHGSLGGFVEVSADGSSLRYLPFPGASGTETFQYAVAGGVTAEVNVRLRSPVEDNDYRVWEQSDTIQLDVMANDDLGSRFAGPREITAVSFGSGGGRVEIAEDGQSILYTPHRDFSGIETFEYVVGDQVAATVRITVDRVLENDAFWNLSAGQSHELNVLDNDDWRTDVSDDVVAPDVDDSRITLVVDPPNGEAVISDDGRSIVFTPDPGFTGYDSFHYIVDGKYEARVQVGIDRVGESDFVEAFLNRPEIQVDVLGNDRLGPVGGLAGAVITDISEPTQGGSLRISDDGMFLLYAPPIDFTGFESATYTINGLYETHISISVGENQVGTRYVPIRQDGGSTALGILSATFFTNGYEGPGIITAFEQPEHGRVELDDNNLFYTPDERFTGSDSLLFTVDGEFEGRININVLPRLENDYFNKVVSPAFDDISIPVLYNDLVDGARITAVTQPTSSATARISADGMRVILTPTRMGYASITFSYTVNDAYETTARVNLQPSVALNANHLNTGQNGSGTVIDVVTNDEFGDATPRVWDPVTRNYIDTIYPYDGAREITAVGETSNGGSAVVSADGSDILYVPAADFVGVDTFTYEVDGQYTGTVYVNVVRAVRDDQASVIADSTDNTIPVLVNDPLGADYSGAGLITSVSEPDFGGTVAISEDGQSISYTPASEFTGTDTFEYRVDGTQVATVTVNVGRTIDDLLQRFESPDDFREWLIEDALNRYSWQFGTENGPIFLEDRLRTFDVGGTTTATTSTPAFSETNVQVAGVDEADLVENDGEHLYVLSGSDLIIVKAWPAEELDEISRVSFDGTPIGMYLHDGRLTVVTKGFSSQVETDDDAEVTIRPGVTSAALNSATAIDAFDGRWWGFPIAPVEDQTIVTILDVSDASNPELVRKTTFESTYSESRSIDGMLHLILEQTGIFLPGPELVPIDEPEPIDDGTTPADDGNETLVSDSLIWKPTHRYETEEEYLARVTADFDEQLRTVLPTYETIEADGTVTEGLLVDPADIARLQDSASATLLSVVSLKTNSDLPAPVGTESLLTSGSDIVYATRDHLYILATPTTSFLRVGNEGDSTQIQQFNWDNVNGGIELTSTGFVPGTPTDQFAVDEFDGRLRITTSVTRSTVTGTKTVTDLYVLESIADQLQPIGSALDVARGDQLKAVRFMGDRAFAATYNSSSPLQIIDLSDPTSPQPAGKVRSIGFPSYMQLIDEAHVLTVGRNAVGGFQGPTQITLYRISDPENPVVLDQDTLPRFSQSIAESDHHAFGWFGFHDTLAIPSSRSFSERVDHDGDGFRESRETRLEDTLHAFRIDTSVDGRSESAITTSGSVSHDRAILRSAFIGDVLYSIGDGLIQAVDINDPSIEINEVVLDFTPIPVPLPIPRITFQLDAVGFAASAVRDGAVPAPAASVRTEDRTLTVDLTDVPDADVTITYDDATREYVLTYHSTTLDTDPIDERVSALGVRTLEVFLGSGDDSIDLSQIARAIVHGGDGDDTMIGGFRGDTLHGDGGNDVLHGRDGQDVLNGGHGDDRLLGQAKSDRINGGGGHDYVAGQSGDDVLRGGAGNDILLGARGNDNIDGGSGDDTGRGGAGMDTMFGGDGNDRLKGQGGRDQMGGGLGNDVIDGGKSFTIIREQADADYSLSGDMNSVTTTGIGTDRWRGRFGGAILTGGDSDNTIDASGFNGPVRLFGMDGDDVLLVNVNGMRDGGPGADVFIRAKGVGDDRPLHISSDNRPDPIRLADLELDDLHEAFQDVASRAGVDLNQVDLVNAELFDFPNSGIGLPDAEITLQVITPGIIVRFQAADLIYRYHGTTDGPLFFAETETGTTTESSVADIDLVISDAIVRLIDGL